MAVRRREVWPAISMTGRIRKLLLIEDDATDARLIRGALADARGGPISRFTGWRKISDGVEFLRTDAVGAIFADLFLPDSRGIETLERLLVAAPQTPIVVLCGVDDEDVALRSVQRGARDYLLKGYLDSYSFSRALQNMLERKATEDALFAEKERAQVTLDSIGGAVLSTDISGKITSL